MSTDLTVDLDQRREAIFVCTVFEPKGYKIVKTLGLVRGNTIRARHVGHDLMAALKGLVGGEISEYTKMFAESREQALDRMRTEAVFRGANGIVGVQFTTSMIMQGTSEILAYGTAVILEPDES